MSAVMLAKAIRRGETSSRSVVSAHIERLRESEPLLNAIVQDRYEDALADADRADRLVAEAADAALPPLLGVPCTIKESIALLGMPNCGGVVHRREHRSATTAPSAQRLIDAGMIPLGVTNTSELTIWIESNNKVYGRTNNAYSTKRTAGGSSGGEGAVVGSGGSPVGLGSDIAGSIRLPAFFNGVFGHKPTSGIVPNTGQWPYTRGDASTLLSIGPITRRADDLMPALRAIAGPDGEDADVRAVELGDPAGVRMDDLTVVVPEDTWLLPPSRELLNARERAAGALAAAGAIVHNVSMKSLRRALEHFLTVLSNGDDAVSLVELLQSDGGRPVTSRSTFRSRRDLHTWPTLILLNLEKLAHLAPESMNRRSLAAGRALATEINDTIGGGVMLYPPHARVAPRHGHTVPRPWSVTPTAIFNLAGTPVTQVPMGLNAEGLPLGVQVVAKRDNDHVSIACAVALEEAFGGWAPPYRAAQRPQPVVQAFPSGSLRRTPAGSSASG